MRALVPLFFALLGGFSQAFGWRRGPRETRGKM